ncbi:MAG: 50S ribosomal protein L10 [Bacilli bacterium]
MANQKIIAAKQNVVNEIADKVKASTTTVLFEYHGLTVNETMELRKKLRETGSDYKVYKNTLVKRALDSLNINMDDELNGPKAVAFGNDVIAPIKVLNDFAKKHPSLLMKVGYVDGQLADINMLNQLALIPSREGLLTMLAGGLIGVVKDLSISLNLYSQNLEK